MKWIFDKRLPRASLFTIRRIPASSFGRLYARFRYANAYEFCCGYFRVTIRAPWLDQPAKQLHPELFGLDALGRPIRERAPQS